MTTRNRFKPLRLCRGYAVADACTRKRTLLSFSRDYARACAYSLNRGGLVSRFYKWTGLDLAEALALGLKPKPVTTIPHRRYAYSRTRASTYNVVDTYTQTVLAQKATLMGAALITGLLNNPKYLKRKIENAK